MRKCKTEQIHNVVLQFLREEGIETPYNQYRVVKAWSTVMGEVVSKYTQEVFVKGQDLHVKITSPALKQNLMSEHRSIARRLNEFIDAQVIEDVVFF